MKPIDKPIFDALLPEQAMALTLFLEAEGEPHEGKVAVAFVIWDRANHPAWWGKDIPGVCFHPMQFSSYNDDNPRYPLALKIASDFEEACKHDVILSVASVICNK